jgi:protein-arginine deiminase
MLEEQQAAGNGWLPMFGGTDWERSIDDVLSDPDVMGASASAVAEVDAQLAVLKAETGLGDEEIVPVPFLHHAPYGKSVAYQPGTVNGVYLSDADWGAPDPHGPVVNGNDIFKTQHEAALGALGITVHFIEDFYLYHVSNGEVHCGTNSTRSSGSARWWESGR